MPTLAHHFLTMAYNNAWSNYRLLSACRQLSQADFVAPRTSFFPSIKSTLNHNLTVDWFYVDALERSRRGAALHPDPWCFFEPEEPFETCTALAAEQRAVDERLIDYCRELDAAVTGTVTVPRRAGPMREPVPRLLAHLFQHQIHHRGQAHAMLADTTVAPPQLDEFFCTNEAELRAADFAALGFSEAQIWTERV